MKILIVQLARYGDIFLTWPTLSALRRRHPDAEIHLLARTRFAAAAVDCPHIDRLWCFDTAQILGPILGDQTDVGEALHRLNDLVENLSLEDFDRVINLSFSPLSSYLTSLIAPSAAVVRGYTRTADGYLAIPDDPSAYFYAQVGVGRFNRYHLAEIFAAVAEVELTDSDWQAGEKWRERDTPVAGRYIVAHLNSSQSKKSYPAFKWQRVLKQLAAEYPGRVVLIGSGDEREEIQSLLLAAGLDQAVNLAGRTDFGASYALIRDAELLIGADSAPMHLASFTVTPCLNLSFASVNYWETGPRSPGSRIVYADSPAALPSDRVVQEALAMLEERDSGFPVVVRTGQNLVGYQALIETGDDFAWRLIGAIYSAGEWPVIDDPLEVAALGHMREAATLAVQQIDQLRDPARRRLAVGLMEQSDQAITAMKGIVPRLQPLIAWFETERLRLGPQNLESLIQKTAEIYGQFLEILNLYLGAGPADREEELR